MKKYGIKSVRLSIIYMRRRELITKEKMENYCKGKEDRKDSVNDDLESFFEDIQLGKDPNDEVLTYFLPKLTEKELKFAVNKKFISADLWLSNWGGNVDPDEMRLSESKLKYVKGQIDRRTYTIDIFPTNRKRKHSSSK